MGEKRQRQEKQGKWGGVIAEGLGHQAGYPSSLFERESATKTTFCENDSGGRGEEWKGEQPEGREWFEVVAG